ncbi:hypothetical protein HDU91_000241, partial [Kappamyces sp. JEL0680]
LKASGLVEFACSEETSQLVPMGGSTFSVAFDPLDGTALSGLALGSSVVDVNLSVGSIFGVWPSGPLAGKSGRDLVFSLMAVYGPKTSVALAYTTTSGSKQAVELVHVHQQWTKTRSFHVAPEATTFAPGNLRAVRDHASYSQLVDSWIQQGRTLRYSGGLVPDLNHILVKGQGILSNVPSPQAKAKLRLVYEGAPVAMILEYAGASSLSFEGTPRPGMAHPCSVLDLVLGTLDERIGLCIGSSTEVDKCRAFLIKK